MLNSKSSYPLEWVGLDLPFSDENSVVANWIIE